MNTYGLDVSNLGSFITKPVVEATPWGARCIAVSRPEFGLERITLRAGGTMSFRPPDGFEATLFPESGSVTVEGIPLANHETMLLESGREVSVAAVEPADLYVFMGPADPGAPARHLEKGRPTDWREKYWGDIQTIVGKAYTGKRLFCRRGSHASLEFHCRKVEGYFIHSGKLLLRFRAGRAEDRFFELGAGSAGFMPPGLMHQRGGLEDTVIMEISTRDDDADSFLVEDGQSGEMPRLGAGSEDAPKGKKKICFDLDGVICTETHGDYENARPVPEAVALVNKLYDGDNTIVIHTSRFMGRHRGDVGGVYREGFAFTKRQLAGWGVRYHALVMGKLRADVIVDDRAVFFAPDWNHIEEEILNPKKRPV